MSRGFLIVPLLVLTLSGCTVMEPQAVPTQQPTAGARSVVPSPAATPSPSSTVPYPLAPAPPGYVTVVPDQYLGAAILTNDIYRVEVPSADSGPAQYATGTPIMEGSKVVAYKVASGDIYDFVVKRFGLSNDGYVIAVNAIRRGNVNLYAGDVLNLSAYTMRKYGSVNGKVMRNPDPDPMPLQEP